MSYTGFVTKIMNIRVHPNADKLVLANCFHNTVCVAKDMYEEGELVLYFPVDGQLSERFCQEHDLIERHDENGKKLNSGYLTHKRNIKAIKLRGEQSDGLVMKLSALEFTGIDISSLTEGTTIDTVNGIEICRKYVPPVKQPKTAAGGAGKRIKRRAKRQLVPTFFEHKDTEQLQYNLAVFRPGDLIEITRKLHGTSQRTGYHKVFQGYKRTFWDKLLRREGTPIYDWGYVCGTRRTVIDNDSENGGFYGSHEFRMNHHKVFEGKLWKGETVYYEVVGFTHDGTPIMSPASNKKTNDKEFIKRYGKTTIFSYGCDPNGMRDNLAPGCVPAVPDKPQSDIYVYRMTMTNEDGDVVEYTPEFTRYRCEQMGVKFVPVEWYGFIPDEEVFTGTSCEYTDPGEFVLEKAEEFYDGPEPIDPSHVREGVVVRILNRPTFAAYKHKNFNFKVIEGIAKADAETADMEEADGLGEDAAEAETV